jgi:hypothetical protein
MHDGVQDGLMQMYRGSRRHQIPIEARLAGHSSILTLTQASDNLDPSRFWITKSIPDILI